MTTNPTNRPSPASDAEPSLRAGDRLDRETFHRLYEQMPPGFRAELIGGMVIVPSPVSLDHSDVHATVIGWLFLYRVSTPGVKVLDNASTALTDEAEPQPDASLLILPDWGGQTRFERKIVHGAPELVVEVSYSSVSIDLNQKKNDYLAAGVREYIVLLVQEDRVEWFGREQDQFRSIPSGPDGIHRSLVFPGLWLDGAALFQDDHPRVIEVLQQGLATPEHAAFVADLQARRPRP